MAAVVCALFCCLYLAWIITRGRPLAWDWPSKGEGYYGLLARGFAKGHTYLDVKPEPELLALPDPYEPIQNQGLRLHDALLYQNRYYLYWGPVPALLLVPLKMLPERWQFGTPDELLVMVATLGLIFTSAALLVLVRERLFPTLPWWTVGVGVLASGLMHPVPFTMARPEVYEAAIVGGQCLLVMGIWLAFKGLDRQPRYALLTIAALLWGLAAGTRVSLAPTVAILAALAMVRILFFYPGVAARQKVLASAGLAAPLIASAIGLALYNKVRFGAFTDYGRLYQLSGEGQNTRALGDIMISASYVRANLVRYLFEWVRFEHKFPYLVASAHRPEFLTQYHLPSVYIMEPLVGIVWVTPFLLLGIIPVVALLRGRSSMNDDQERWLTLSLLAAAVVSVLPPLVMLGSTMRYQLDGSPSFVMLATLGIFQWARANQSSGRSQGALAMVVAPLWTVSIVFGVLLGMSGYIWTMREGNPQLWQWISAAFPTL